MHGPGLVDDAVVAWLWSALKVPTTTTTEAKRHGQEACYWCVGRDLRQIGSDRQHTTLPTRVRSSDHQCFQLVLLYKSMVAPSTHMGSRLKDDVSAGVLMPRRGGNRFGKTTPATHERP
jgi:hypothetical protein